MNRKTTITIIIIILLLIAGGALIYWFYTNQKTEVVDDSIVIEQPTDNEPSYDLSLDDDGEVTVSDEPQPLVEGSLVGAVYYFVERWGTYSNMSEFQNIKDLKGAVSDELYNKAMINYKPVPFNELDDIAYEGYEAKVLGLDWQDQSASQATVMVSTQRRHMTDDSSDAYPQDILVRLQKQGDEWIVVEAVWQAREQF